MTRIDDLLKSLMSMFIANGVSTKKEVLDFLKTIEEVAKYVSSFDWTKFQQNMMNDASQLIVKMVQENSRNSNSHRSSDGHRGHRNRSNSPTPTLSLNIQSLPSSHPVRGVHPVNIIPGIPIFGNPFLMRQ